MSPLLFCAPRHDPAEVAEAVDRILRDPVFTEGARRVEVASWIPEWLARIQDWFADLWSGLGDLSGDSPVLFWIVVGVLGAILVWLLYRVARAGGIGPLSGAASASATEPERRRRRARQFWEEAHVHAAAGDYREALRHLVLALAAQLRQDEQRAFSNAWTNHELRVRLAGEGFTDADFDRLVDAVDRAWYGNGRADAEDFEHGRDAVRRLANLPDVDA
ncbi:MAG: DUF4129 domain-containing protein [Planctomycetota bacterium]|jgi:hypothetical protein